MAGRDTMRMPRSNAPASTTIQELNPAEAKMMVIMVAMNSTWWPVRKT